jgi:putative ABC transport system permease protein
VTLSNMNKKLLRELNNMRMQALAIALVMAAGIATFVMSFGVINSLDETRRVYYDEYRFADIFVGLKRAPDTLAKQMEKIPGVTRVMTRVIVGATLDVPGLEQPASAMVVSIPEGRQPTLNALYLRSGRLVEAYRENEVVVSDAFADENNLVEGDTISAIISGHQRTLEIVGIGLSPEFVYMIPPGSLMPDNTRFGILWMGRKALEAAHDLDGAFNDAAIEITPGARVKEIVRQLDVLTRPYGGLGAYGRDEHVSDMFVENELDQLRAMTYVVPVIFLAIAGMLLHMVLSRIINMEREQIGILKALGFTGYEIGSYYAKMALVIGLVGLVVGTSIGLYMGNMMAALYIEFFRFPSLQFVFSAQVITLATMISLGGALLGALRSVRSVMKLPAAVAMQAEPPPTFKPVLIERLGLTRLISPAGRMIFRQLERRAKRSVGTAVAIATSLGVLIGAAFTLDSIDFILDVQFNQSEREDIGLSLIEASDQQAFLDMASMPGVMQAEPYRSVPVKLKFGHRTERLAILGMRSGGDMHRTLDTSLTPVAIPNDGVVLSEKLARDLQAGVGDLLTFEALEGRRPTRSVYVSGVVQQYMGIGAFMDLTALNILMQEGPSVSGAWLKVDESRLSQFYQKVRETPSIAGLSIRKAAMESFTKLIAENIVQMTIANIGFAALIAFGVVYNSARISLSERARELASMRVLGFSRKEISAILLGELSILIFAAIPIGYLMGYGLASAIVVSLDTELFRIPLIINKETYGLGGLTILVAGALSALAVRRRLDHLDLVAVLKSRE